MVETNEKILVKARINGRVLRDMLGRIQQCAFLIDETYLHVTEQGIKLSVVSSSHDALSTLVLDRADFDSFHHENEGRAGINLNDLVKIGKRIKMDEAAKYDIVIGSKVTIGTFTLRTYEIQGYDAKEDSLLDSFEETLAKKFAPGIPLDADAFTDQIGNCELISDLVQLHADPEKKTVLMSARDESGECNERIAFDYSTAITVDGIFSLKALKNAVSKPALAPEMRKSTPKKPSNDRTRIVVLFLGDNIPCMIRENFQRRSRMTALIAARVTDTSHDNFGDDFDDGSEAAPGSEATATPATEPVAAPQIEPSLPDDKKGA
nr:hypothetical protein [Candidatus Sigynarchaeota archaeon]